MRNLEGRIDGHKSFDIVERENLMVGSLIDMVDFYKLEAKVLVLDNQINIIKNSLKSIID